MTTFVASYAYLAPSAAMTQSSISPSSSSTSSPSTGFFTPSTSSSTPSSTPSPTRVSEIARVAILTPSSSLITSNVTLIGESEALRRWKTAVSSIETLKTQLVLSFELKNYREVRTIAESILKIQPYNRIAIKYMEAIREKQIEIFKEKLKSLFDSGSYNEATRTAHILLEINPCDSYAQSYLDNIEPQIT